MYQTRRKNLLVVKGLKCHLFLLIISEGQSELPESKYLRVENKVFYFDAGSNRRGVYLRVSEVCMKLSFQDVKTCSFKHQTSITRHHHCTE